MDRYKHFFSDHFYSFNKSLNKCSFKIPKISKINLSNRIESLRKTSLLPITQYDCAQKPTLPSRPIPTKHVSNLRATNLSSNPQMVFSKELSSNNLSENNHKNESMEQMKSTLKSLFTVKVLTDIELTIVEAIIKSINNSLLDFNLINDKIELNDNQNIDHFINKKVVSEDNYQMTKNG